MKSRMKIWFKLGLVVLLLSFVAESESAVMSVDLGSEWMKVAVVNLKPGQTPISVAINEMSKRKSPALVAFEGGDRRVGEQAASNIARYPDKVYSQFRDMIGKPFEHVKAMVDSLYLPYDLVKDSRGAASIKIDDGVTIYSAEELVAMLLSYSLNLAETHSKVPIKDAVITVPPYFGQAERKGLVQAAQLAGINVLSLINEHSGAALQYGIDKDFSNESRHVIFYDMGLSSTYAALVYFSAYNSKEYGKTTSVNQFQVKDVRWNTKLGGQNMDLHLVEYFADEFNSKVGNGVDVRNSPKAMAKLKKQVKRTREILSANTVAPISVESIYDDIDYRSTITREKFEELCADLWEQSLIPVKEVLKHSGLKVDKLFAVELIGGATRVPKLQVMLQEFLGRKDLDKHLDADEAMVRGGALHAANLSDGIKLNRKLGMIDGSSYGYFIELDGPDLLKDENSKQLLVPRMKKLPSKMFRSIKHNKDFEVSLSYESADPLPPGVPSDKFAQYKVSGLTDASEKYASRNLSSPIKANLHFSLSRSGIVSFDQAEAVIEISEWVDVPVKNLTVEDSSTVTSNSSVEASLEKSSDGNKENSNIEGGASNTSDPTIQEKSSASVVTEKKLKKRTFRVPLKIVEIMVGPGMSLSEESLSEAKARLEMLDKKDAETRRTEELKNSLEGYIYATREKLEASAKLEKISTKQERQSFIDKLDEVQEWLYAGEDAPASEFEERLSLLKAIGDPIFFRLNELTARPAASENAQRYLSELQKIVSGWEKNKSWLPKARIDEILSEADKLKNWLEEKEAQQKITSGFDTAVFTSEEVYDMVADLKEKVAKVNKIPKPKPKIEKPPKEEKESRGENGTSSNSTSDNNSQSEQPTGEPIDSSNNEADSESEPHDEL
ncbi:heat shock 70 kDa protein 17-like [Tasmannia lanceolata]|uniref:heat shock 70 kDa protein 17-like n=1 Tax=Tasmannia lanceolata TaxID=3420 RepID=UPI0040636CA9